MGQVLTPLRGKSALVTGGTRGIGAAIAGRLQADGATVAVTGRAPDGAAPAGMTYFGVDLTDAAAVEGFAQRVAGMDVDILVNNAGINRIAPFSEVETADFDQIVHVNLRAPFLLCRAVLPGMRARRWGRIINIASIFSIVSKAHRAAYSASKFGLDGLTAALAAEVASAGVLANCVSPGVIETDMTRQVLDDEARAAMVGRIPAGRLGEPAEIAALVAWLAGPESSYVSGQNFVVDGGFVRV